MKADMFLSPYAIWKIELEPVGSAESLRICRHKNIDLELIGRGQYFEDESSLTSQFCTEELDKYTHHLDKALSDKVHSLKKSILSGKHLHLALVVLMF